VGVVLTALLGAGGLLLLVAGGAKAADPTRTAGALAALGWPSSPALVRAGAVVEALVGAAALILGGLVVATLVTASYAALAVFVGLALRADTPVASCGCFGQEDTPPSVAHVVTNVVLALGALGAAAAGATPVADASAPEVVAAVAVGALAYVVLTQPSVLSSLTSRIRR
jgi:hypothetical protein